MTKKLTLTEADKIFKQFGFKRCVNQFAWKRGEYCYQAKDIIGVVNKKALTWFLSKVKEELEK